MTNSTSCHASDRELSHPGGTSCRHLPSRGGFCDTTISRRSARQHAAQEVALRRDSLLTGCKISRSTLRRSVVPLGGCKPVVSPMPSRRMSSWNVKDRSTIAISYVDTSHLCCNVLQDACPSPAEDKGSMNLSHRMRVAAGLRVIRQIRERRVLGMFAVLAWIDFPAEIVHGVSSGPAREGGMRDYQYFCAYSRLSVFRNFATYGRRRLTMNFSRK